MGRQFGANFNFKFQASFVVRSQLTAQPLCAQPGLICAAQIVEIISISTHPFTVAVGKDFWLVRHRAEEASSVSVLILALSKWAHIFGLCGTERRNSLYQCSPLYCCRGQRFPVCATQGGGIIGISTHPCVVKVGTHF